MQPLLPALHRSRTQTPGAGCAGGRAAQRAQEGAAGGRCGTPSWGSSRARSRPPSAATTHAPVAPPPRRFLRPPRHPRSRHHGVPSRFGCQAAVPPNAPVHVEPPTHPFPSAPPVVKNGCVAAVAGAGGAIAWRGASNGMRMRGVRYQGGTAQCTGELHSPTSGGCITRWLVEACTGLSSSWPP
jgi:hypothetical protein